MKDRFKTHEIMTATGGMIDLDDIDPDRVKIEDIVSSLCVTVRFGGHLPCFYSVGSHTVAMYIFASRCREPDGVLRHILLHDMHEFITGDIPSPVKRYLQPAIGKLERRIDEAIFTRFGHLPTPSEKARVKYYDDLMWRGEMLFLAGVDWDTPDTVDYISLQASIEEISRRNLHNVGEILTGMLHHEFNTKRKKERMQ